MLKQRTLRNSIKAVGIGLHTGKNINMELIPSEANSGINFIRTDVDENLVIPAIAENIIWTTGVQVFPTVISYS